MKVKMWMVVGAVLFGVFGFSVAWYKASTSNEVALARKYLLEAPEMEAKYRQIRDPLLIGFRLYAHNGGRSYCTFLVNTSNGYKVVQVLINKQTEPWEIREA